jgi:hypothetical protein
MKNILFVVIVLTGFSSCKKDNFKIEYYPDGNLRSKIEINDKKNPNGIFEEFYNTGILKTKTHYKNGIISDTLYNYYENGKIKEKGLVEGKQMLGWWSYYDKSGKLTKKAEYLIRDGESFLNQEISFDNQDNINYSLSSFFKLDVKDTLSLGKNIGKLKYYTNSKDYELRYVYIIIENEYADRQIKNDTFTDDIDKLWFGINANKKGELKIKGIIQEELLFKKKINKDSTELIIKKNNKYFEKKVFVKEKV